MTDKKYDVLIIGAGVTGALCAWKLGHAGLKVLILEVADQPTDMTQREEFREVMTPNINRGDMHAPYLALASRRYAPSPEAAGRPEEKHYDLAGPEMFKAQYIRLVGGTTWAFRGNTPRFVPNDFKLKTEYGIGEDWPINYQDLEPWYVEAEKQLGVAGNHEEWNGLLGGYRSKPFPMDPIPLSYGDKLIKKKLDGKEMYGKKIRVVSTPQARATRSYRPVDESGIPYKEFDDRHVCEGNSNCIPLCPSGAKYDGGIHVRAAIRTGNVDLKWACIVTQIITDDKGRVTEVRYKNWRNKDINQEHKAKAKAIILAANAIESPRLLLMSNLANSSGQVGRNLMDHLQDEMTAFFPEELYPFRGPQSTCSIEVFRDGPFRKQHSAIRMTVGNDGHGRARSPLDVMDENLGKGIFGEELYKTLAKDIPRMFRISFSTEVPPNPNNRVTLSTKVDGYGLPRPLIYFAVDSYTYNALKKGHEIALSLIEGIPGIDKTKIKEREWSPKWGTAAHIMGTCRMGDDPSTSVVNTNGQTHDHPNLYIVGSSIFTTSGTANPTLTASALALKTADAVYHRYS